MAFDLLALGERSFLAEPFVERRRHLENVLAAAPSPLRLTPITDEAAVAAAWLDDQRDGVDGVVAKRRDLPYAPGRRAMFKMKRERTGDCVVAGFRWMAERPLLGSLLLGLYDDDGALRHVGVVTSFSERRRRELPGELEPLVTALAGHPWEHGFGLGRSPVGRLLGAAGRWAPREMPLDWVPLRPELVCEVAYDQVDAYRFRHPARFRRWRPDRDPRSCTLDQLDVLIPAS